MVEIDPSDFRAAKAAPRPVGLSEAAGRIVLQAETQAGALDLVWALIQRAASPELAAFEEAIAEAWHDPPALSLATARASSSLDQKNDPVSK